MNNIVSAVRSSVGKKIITGLTGIALVGFIVVHLLGNLTLFLGEHGLAFNEYAHFLEGLAHGWLLPVAEISLILLFTFHIVSTLAVTLRNRQARPIGYVRVADAGHTSRKTPSSQSMIWTGLVLMAFVLFHVYQFRLTNFADPVFYPDMPKVKDLYRLVYHAFHDNVGYVVLYCGVMVLLGLHLRHGFWSAWQSIGLNNRRWLPFFFGAAVAFAVLMALGFFILPIYLHFAGPEPAIMAPAAAPPAIPGGH